jgi:hypothetical protein
VVDHDPTEASVSCDLGCVHRLDLSVSLIELFQSPHGKELTILANTEEGDVVGFETGRREHMHLIERTVLGGVGEVGF